MSGEAVSGREERMTDVEFAATCQRVQGLLGLDDQGMADKCMVSRPTFMRWKRGRNLPHGALRRGIVRLLADALDGAE